MSLVSLVTSLLVGKDFVFYGIAFITVQMVLNCTHLVRLIDSAYPVNFKRIVMNPNILAIMVGLFLFFFQTRLPPVIADVTDSMVSMAGPLTMLMAEIPLKETFLQPRYYFLYMEIDSVSRSFHRTAFFQWNYPSNAGIAASSDSNYSGSIRARLCYRCEDGKYIRKWGRHAQRQRGKYL